MAFLSRFFTSPERKPLPSLEEILAARDISMDLPGLAEHADEFRHLSASERPIWGASTLERVSTLVANSRIPAVAVSRAVRA